jgi:hypothetical protein
MYSDIFDLDQLSAGGANAAGRNARRHRLFETLPSFPSRNTGKMNLARLMN